MGKKVPQYLDERVKTGANKSLTNISIPKTKKGSLTITAAILVVMILHGATQRILTKDGRIAKFARAKCVNRELQ